MSAIPISTLLEEAKCYACYEPADVPTLAKLALLSRITSVVADIAVSTLASLTSPDTAGTSFTTSTFQPSANALVLAFVFKDRDTIVTSITGNGLTWEEVQGVTTVAGTLQGLIIYRAMGAAPTSTALNVTTDNPNGAGVIIFVQQYENVATGANGANAIVQRIPTISNECELAPLDSNGRNAIVGVTLTDANPTGALAPAGWTTDLNVAQSPAETIGGFVAHRAITTDSNYTTGAAFNFASIALEIRSAASSARAVALPSTIPNLEVWSRSDTGVWQDAAKTVPCVADGDLVYTWENMGNTALAADWIQATAGLRPVYNATGGINGKPRISFNNDMLRLLSGNFPLPFTLVVVGKYTANSGGIAPLMWDDTSNTQLSVVDPSAFAYIYTGTVRESDSATTASPFYKIAGVTLFPPVSYMYSDGHIDFEPSELWTGANTITTALNIGGWSGGTYYLIGDEYEVMFFSRTLTTDEISVLETYLEDRYGITHAP